eukprot:CAMPEP_0172301236 /NCGR_PEP_ID=MMETSP1058-20130122/3169_1 /TAXON_ID=83371 /ORGANISM="Detonula confervacea, Strain CCMP 353" /LENGTH=35 /DNA_ID= /DNA_START= /DNA_END= /DNA_ORIENTATION=
MAAAGGNGGMRAPKMPPFQRRDVESLGSIIADTRM